MFFLMQRSKLSRKYMMDYINLLGRPAMALGWCLSFCLIAMVCVRFKHLFIWWFGGINAISFVKEW